MALWIRHGNARKVLPELRKDVLITYKYCKSFRKTVFSLNYPENTPSQAILQYFNIIPFGCIQALLLKQTKENASMLAANLG